MICRLIFNFISIGLLLLQACNKEDDIPRQELNPVWEYNYGIGLTDGIVPIVHGNMILVSSRESSELESSSKLIALNKTTGKRLWEWSDPFEPAYEHFSAKSLKPVYDNRLAMTIGSRNFCIDLTSGQTLWKNRNANSTSRSSLNNLGPLLYRTDIASGTYTDRMMEGNFFTGEWRSIFEVHGGDSIRQGLQIPAFYFEEDGDTIMVFTNTLHDQIRNVIVPRLISFNKTRKELYYDILLDEPAVGNAVDWLPVLNNGKVYIAVDDLLVCHNAVTGEQLWTRALGANILASNFLIIDDRVYIHTEGYGTLWCFDAEKGFILWEKASVGNPSYLNYHEGILYYVAGTYLWAVDCLDGKTLAQIRAPSSYKDSNDFFSTLCTVDPETGNIYVASWSTAYCYPPYRR